MDNSSCNKENRVKPITIVDAPCGAGKTSYAIQMINQKEERSSDRKFIFITPYLDEVDRIKTACPEQEFHDPTGIKGKTTKSSNFKKLLEEGKNIATTHALFRIIDEEAMELIRMDNYTLILDEVLDVVSKEPVSAYDLRLLFKQDLITCEEDGTVLATEESKGYSGKFSDLIHRARMKRLIYMDDNLLMWQFPSDIFLVFDEVFVLTYLFDGQIQKAYYDLHGVDYQYRTVSRNDDTGDYFLSEFTSDYDRDFKQSLQDSITIYEGRLNKVGVDFYSLSKNWYTKNVSRRTIKKTKDSLYNYMRNIIKGKSSDNMWTCFKDHKKHLTGNGYARGFVFNNARATNEYRDRKNLAYMINKFLNTPIDQYFKHKGITIDQGLYAVSELIQWLLRSQVRDGKPINLYIPSRRMRELLLKKWLAGEPLGEDREKQPLCAVA